MRSPFLRCLVLLAALSSVVAAAEEEGPAPVETRLKRVALFKNGLGFFVREAALTGSQKIVLLGPFAAPSHGTFWVGAPTTVGLKNVVAREATVEGKAVVARDVPELLRANVGKQISIPDINVVGTIVGFAPDRLSPVLPASPYQMGAATESREIIPWGRGEYVLVKTEAGIVALSPHAYQRITFVSEEIGTKFQPQVPGAELQATLTNPGPGDWLSVSYLAKGITWAPSYLIDISDPKQARLSAKAVVINEAEGLKATHVDLITGYPNLRFADILSPLARKTDLVQFLQALSGTGPRPESRLAANVMTQAVSFGRGEAGLGGIGGGGAFGPSYGAAVPGQAAEDLFLYPVENVTLAEGETGYYPLFTESVPYSEFYEWEVPDYINPSDSYSPPPQPEQQVVWHSIRLTNTTKVPWTTAPAEVVKNGQIIGQDVLSYTPPSPRATVTVKITQSPSVRAEQSELETKRERDAVVLYGDHFDRVTIGGTLQITNYQDKSISVEAKKTLSGELKAAAPKAKEVTLARGLARMNPAHDLTWTLSLKPQESREITYTYQALIRR